MAATVRKLVPMGALLPLCLIAVTQSQRVTADSYSNHACFDKKCDQVSWTQAFDTATGQPITGTCNMTSGGETKWICLPTSGPTCFYNKNKLETCNGAYMWTNPKTGIPEARTCESNAYYCGD
jgi:hypothetical protein